MFNKTWSKRLRRFLGKRYKRRTEICVCFELATPTKDFFDPAEDEVLVIDMLDNLQRNLMEFHDIPGFRIVNLTINKKMVL